MSYVKHNFQTGDILYASELNEMDDQIALNESGLSDLSSEIEPLEASVEALEETQYDPYIVDTASGDIASFPDGADGVPVKRLVANIEPVQDLHGYENPWPGGGSKNQLPVRDSGLIPSSMNGVTITNNGDGTYKLNGTATDVVYFDVYNSSDGTASSIATGTYILSGSIGGSGTTWRLNLYSGSSLIAQSTNGDSSATISSGTTIRATIYVNSGTTLNNVTFYPMLRLSTVSDSTFAPYSNICPITGWTEANGTRCGKNLVKVELGYTYNTNTGVTIDDPNIYSSAKVPVNFTEHTNYVYSCDNDNPGFIYAWDKYGNFVGRTSGAVRQGNTVLSKTDFNLGNGGNKAYDTIRYLAFNYYHAQSSSDYSTIATAKIQLEPGSTATTYEPYDATTIPIAFPSSAGTVYGGTLNVTSGELTVDRAKVTLNGTETINGLTYNRFRIPLTGYVPVDTSVVDESLLCDELKTVSYDSISPSLNFLISGAGVGTGSICVKIDSTIDGVVAFRAWLAEHTPDVVYKLDTPTTYQLTPTQVTTLLGTNNVWFDTGDTACEYRADTKKYITKVIAAALNA